MKSHRRLGQILMGVIATGLMSGCGSGPSLEAKPAADVMPLDATYEIEGDEIPLRDGFYERTVVPGSAAKISVAVFEAPVYGDLDADDTTDAAVILVYQGGGSGTFYYLAAAMNQAGEVRGTNAVLLGDRIIPQSVSIQNRAIVVRFLDRGPDDAMAATPDRSVTEYAYVDAGRLVALPRTGEWPGWLTLGHEVRAFRPCGGDKDYWLVGRSPALAELEEVYRRAVKNDARPYTPMFVSLTGAVVDPPTDGFGRDYAGGFFATDVHDANDARHCCEAFVVVEEPVPGATVASPLTVTGRARGTWFFEGDFPILLEDASGNTVAAGFVVAQGEWMTTEFVPFQGSLEFTHANAGQPGWLVFKKDNPSDRRELDDATSIPVFFR
jgi:hypothetical protein